MRSAERQNHKFFRRVRSTADAFFFKVKMPRKGVERLETGSIRKAAKKIISTFWREWGAWILLKKCRGGL